MTIMLGANEHVAVLQVMGRLIQRVGERRAIFERTPLKEQRINIFVFGDARARGEIDMAKRAPVYLQLFAHHGHRLRQYLAGVK